MTEKKSSDIMVPQQGGVVRNMVNQLKLIFRLMGDRRVNFFMKLIPIGTMAYLFSPDPIMIPIIGVVDDAAILWLGSYVFIELCPPEIVSEHLKALNGNMNANEIQDDIVDAETTDVKE